MFKSPCGGFLLDDKTFTIKQDKGECYIHNKMADEVFVPVKATIKSTPVEFSSRSGTFWYGYIKNWNTTLHSFMLNKSVNYSVVINGVEYEGIAFDGNHLDVVSCFEDIPTTDESVGHRLRIDTYTGHVSLYKMPEDIGEEFVLEISAQAKDEVRKFNPDYLPKAKSVSNVFGDTVTPTAFNNLLNALRSAGYMGY